MAVRDLRDRESDEPAFVGLVTSGYVEQAGEWRLALYQQTPHPPLMNPNIRDVNRVE